MLTQKFDLMQIFADVSPFPGKWEPFAGKQHELSQVQDVINRFNEYADEAKKYINSIKGLKIASEFNLSNDEVVEKNISWLTSISLLKLNHLKFTTDSDDPETYRELSSKAMLIKKRLEGFKRTISEGILIPIPTTIEEYDGIYNRSTTTDLGKDILNVGFSNQFIIQQFTEQQITGTPPGVLELLLPRVAKIPFNEVLALRHDYGTLFTHFQNKLANFISESEKSDSEAKLQDLLLNIDDQINRLKKEFEIIDKKKRLEKKGLVYSFGVLSLVLLLPSEIFKSLAALLGTTNILKTMRNIRLLDINRRELEDDPFYIPYKLTKLSRQLEKGN